jgi:SAM-dependent methyltransferase
MDDNIMMRYKFRKNCRLCSSKEFKLVLDLGKQPPSNAFLTRKEREKIEKVFPLRLYLCKTCHHLQLLDVVDKEYLFSNYLYMTSANKPIIQHFEDYVDYVYQKFLKKKKERMVVEIGSNDGTLLKKFLKYDVDVLGIEPAKNLAKISRSFKIKTENNFFSHSIAKKISNRKKADVIIANNILGHVDKLNDFIKGIKILLKDDGVFVFEVPHALKLIKNLEFDTVYHEHLSYFFITPLHKWLRKNELEIFHIQKQDVHGGTIRVFVSKSGSHKERKSVRGFMKEEEKNGINNKQTYDKFSTSIESLRKNLVKKIESLKKKNKIIFGYGAPAKGNVLLNYCKIDNKILDFVTDTTILKQGKLTPGTKIPIISPKDKPKNYKNMIALLLAWNYKDAIIKNEKNFIKNGGRFLIPIPKPVLL